MASLLLRMREMFLAQAHHNLDEMENPKVMAQQLLRDLAEDLSATHRALVTALGAEKALARQQSQWQDEARDWRGKAERLLQSGDEARARGALERALKAETRAAEQDKPLQTARQTTSRLREQASRLKSEWEDARHRCAQIAANQNAAEALNAAGRAGDAYTQAMERMQRLDALSRRTGAFECEAEAAAELLAEREAFERDISAGEQAGAIEAELQALRDRLARAQPPAAR